MKLRKYVSGMLLGLVIAGCMVGCSSEQVVQEETPEQVQQVEQQVKEEEKKEEKKEMNVVIVDNKYCSITVTGLYEDDIWGYGYEILVENKSDVNLLIGANDVSVNGMMCDPFWADTVSAGKKAKGKIAWNEEDVSSLDELIDVEMTFHISDDETWDTLAEEKVILNIK